MNSELREFAAIAALVLCGMGVRAAAGEARVSEAVNEAGVLVHQVESPYQAGTTEIRVLLPDAVRKGTAEAGGRCRVVYVLPVEAGREDRYGDGMQEVVKRDLANRHGVIFVAPTFAQLPWYADPPTEPLMRQERYFVEVVVPAVEARYPAIEAKEGRLLLGFSKSGWGAWTLLLRRPEMFGRAAAWDAPLMMAEAGKYGSGAIFGTQENFAKYRVSTLVRERAEKLRDEQRLMLLGYGGFREEHQRMHALLQEFAIPHVYRDGPQREHVWESGWVEEAVELLLE